VAPEIVRGTGLSDGRSDIYSLGATLYEFAPRRAAFSKPDTPEEILRMHWTRRCGHPPIPPDLSTKTVTLLSSCWPRNRLAHAQRERGGQLHRKILVELQNRTEAPAPKPAPIPVKPRRNPPCAPGQAARSAARSQAARAPKKRAGKPYQRIGRSRRAGVGGSLVRQFRL